jgi:hypothetical protein
MVAFAAAALSQLHRRLIVELAIRGVEHPQGGHGSLMATSTSTRIGARLVVPSPTWRRSLSRWVPS